jgi:acetyltransferase-like isoleucine patch superfamily enzyme
MSRLLERMAVSADYARALWLRMRGARIAPKVRIARDLEVLAAARLAIGTRSVVEPRVTVKLVGAEASLRLGAHVFIGRDCLFDLSGAVEIGDGTMLAPSCRIIDHNHGTAAGEEIWRQECEHRPVRIGRGAWLGAGAIVLPGVTIGDGAVVAAGAVVTKSVEPMAIVAGNPARLIRHRS